MKIEIDANKKALNKTTMDNDVESILLNETEIDEMVTRLGAEISRDYEGKNLLLVCILKGSVLTMADLMRKITIPCSIEFMVVSSYGSETKSSGIVKIVKDLDCPLENYDVLLVEDILDSGRTLSYLKDFLGSRNPRSLKICTLLDKPAHRAEGIDLAADYFGCEIPDGFVVGYGLDYDEKYRNLPYIGILKESVYTK